MIILLETTRMNYSCTKEFEKDFKKLSKRFKSLEEDLKLFKDVLAKFPEGNGRHFNVLTRADNKVVIKARLFCKSLKKSSLRIIYSTDNASSCLEMISIEFIELYFKGDKENEDQKRVKTYLRENLKEDKGL